ncbi:transglycosylase family protein [Streptomyces lacrimifluminis]|uniref:transglycosylase family protein n=1 Tax=Streptomyces lacrimifluminis TaxID=1500077 RepID=UPI0027E47E04|nr:transglycosylase family protein [Streptomyces lacrimifluminis]
MTSSAMAIPLLGATGASAASGTTWDRVAECESGGSWSADAGNGFYGGLQLTQDDWEKYGGLAYAARADQASRSQQIAVGEKILADQGAGAWGACALLSGLGKDAGSADVDTGVVEGDTSGSTGGSGLGLGLGLGPASGSDSSPSSSTSESPTPSASPSTGSPASPGASDSSPSPTPSAGAATGSADSTDPAGSVTSPSPSSSLPGAGDGKESDSSPIDVAVGQELGNSGQSVEKEGGESGTETSVGTGRHRGKAEGTYTGSIGDVLWGVTDSLDLAGGQPAEPAGTASFLDADSGLILPGQTLAVGSEPGQN